MIRKNKMSLTKKLDGGYLNVKKSPNKSSKRGGYADYLHKMNKSTSETNTGGCEKKSCSTIEGGSNRKIVAVKLVNKKSNKSPRKVKKEVKDIPNIIPRKKTREGVAKPEAKPVAKPEKKPVAKPEVKPEAKPEKKPVAKPEAKSDKEKLPLVPSPAPEPELLNKPVKQVGPKIQIPKTKGSLKKNKVLKRSSGKSKGRRLNKSLTKRRKNSLKKGKRISVTKTRKYTNKDISKIQTKLKNIKNKTNEEIKRELEEQGVTLSGKSPEIMKDVYMYSQLCGINIKRE